MPTPPDLDLDAEELVELERLQAEVRETWKKSQDAHPNSGARRLFNAHHDAAEENRDLAFGNVAEELLHAVRTLKNLRDGQECDQMVLVPIRATEAMLNAWTKDMTDWNGVTNEDAQEVYRAMLSASEKAPE